MIWDDEENNEQEEQKVNNPFTASKGKYTYDDSESSEDEKRVLKTPKEKLLSMIKENLSKVREFKDQKNYSGLLKSYTDVIKNADKIKKEFGTSEKLPDSFLRLLFFVEESLNVSKEDKAKLNSKDNTALNSLKKDWKLVKPFEDALKTYRETKPSEEDIEEEEKELSDLSEDKSLSDLSSVDYKDDDQDPAVRRLKWVKKPKDESEKDKEKEKEKDGGKSKPKTKKKTKPTDKLDEKTISEEKQTITEADIEKECLEITNQRGHIQRPLEIVSRLDFLLSQTENLTLKIKLLNLYILICFDTSSGQFSALAPELWNKIHDSIITLIDYYNALSTLSQKDPDSFNSTTTILQTSLVSILEKLELELYKALQFTDQNTSEYVSRIKDELKFLLLCSKIESFYTRLDDNLSIAKIYLLILLHIYYKNEESIKKMIERFQLNINKDEYLIKSCENPENFITQLCNSIYSYCDEKSKIKAMLCNIYFLCVHERYSTAKSLFKKSHIFEVIQILKDDGLKILYNRTLAKLGLSAFRVGNFSECMQFLYPLCQLGTTKLKEFLSQSYNKESEKSIFFDKEEKKRVIPYVLTINIDEVESMYYISSMLLDMPNILLMKLGKPYSPFNPVFKKMLDNFEKQVFNGPPETLKEVILSSSSFMKKGNWKRCCEMITSIRLLNLLKNREEVKRCLTLSIKQTSLRCYIILYANQFSSLSLDILATKFQLETANVKRIISTMILDGELDAKWNDKILILYSSEKNEKLINQLENNLRIITQQNLNLLEVVSMKAVK
jgi:translation initiation factor 3 subunit C